MDDEVNNKDHLDGRLTTMLPTYSLGGASSIAQLQTQREEQQSWPISSFQLGHFSSLDRSACLLIPLPPLEITLKKISHSIFV